jgi:hypothetical protein
VTRSFGLTFDYLCPFARNACEHVTSALRAGAGWDVRFLPYSLAQGHVEEGDVDVWDRDDPTRSSGILALLAGLVVRDAFPEHFLDAHDAFFAARHDEGRDLKDPDVIRRTLAGVGVDEDAVFATIEDGRALKVLRDEHELGVREHSVWGVPTFIAGGRAVFVRVLDRPEGNRALATGRIEQILDLVEGSPMLHEFKQTDLPF